MTINFGDTLTFKATITDEVNVPLPNVNTHLITLINSERKIIETKESCTNLGGGQYQVKITLPDSGVNGVWTLKWRITIGTENETENYYFTVKPPSI